jgi:hypothetical protein
MNREGGCLCGRIRYRLTGEPLTFYACHCTDCQRQTGSAFGYSMITPQDTLEVLKGEPESARIELPDGRIKRICFCAACGTRVWGTPEKVPQVVTLRPGTFDDTTGLRPVGHIWTSSAHPWVQIPDDTLNYSHQPEDMGDLIRAWRSRPRS